MTERHRERAAIFGVVLLALPSIVPAAEVTGPPAPDFKGHGIEKQQHRGAGFGRGWGAFFAGKGACQGATERHRERGAIFEVVSVALPSIAPAAQVTGPPAPDF